MYNACSYVYVPAYVCSMGYVCMATKNHGLIVTAGVTHHHPCLPHHELYAIKHTAL